MKESILLLDDEPSILEILSQFLCEEGYLCESTLSAYEALRLIQEKSYSLLLTDLRMQEMHGIEVVKRAKALDENLAVIVITAHLEVQNAIDAMRAGADDYLLKPFNLSEVSLAIEHALERRRLVIENRRHQEELERRIKEATADVERTNRELLRTKEYLENLLNSSVDAILTVARNRRISYANQGASAMLGYANEELVGAPVEQFFTGKMEEVQYLWRMLKEGKVLQNYETELIHKNGNHIPINMSISMVKDADGRVKSILAICKDITQQKQLERELKEMSIKDGLTGLYNQRYFYDRLEAEIERAKRQGHPLSLLLFDIDQFKQYNDLHGHLEGDKVLKTVAKVVLDCTREHVDVAFRYGGDEFTVILPEANEAQALAIAERIRATFEARRFDHLTLSIGLMSHTQGSSLRSFIRLTDAMMYDAKRAGGNRVLVWNPSKNLELDESEETERETA